MNRKIFEKAQEKYLKVKKTVELNLFLALTFGIFVSFVTPERKREQKRERVRERERELERRRESVCVCVNGMCERAYVCVYV